MENMREIRTRIHSIQETMKITNAMYLMSSSKMKKAKKSLDATVPYFELIQETITDIISHAPEIEHAFFDTRKEKLDEDKKRGYIVMSGDKGLAGAYNHNIIKLTEQQLKKGKDNTLFVLGHVGRQYFSRKNVNMDPGFLYSPQNPTVYRAREIAQKMINLFNSGQLDEVYVIYTKMITSMTEEPRLLRILPLQRGVFEKHDSDIYYRNAHFSPSPGAVLNQLVPNYVKGLLYGTLVEAFACEQNARMMAMDNATNNANDMIRELSLEYNRARQAAITQEITEVVSGAQSSGR